MLSGPLNCFFGG